MSAARHLRLVTEEPAPLNAQTAHQAVGDLTQRYVLELMDALAALIDLHDDPGAVTRGVTELRRSAVHLTGWTFDVALEKVQRRQGAR